MGNQLDAQSIAGDVYIFVDCALFAGDKSRQPVVKRGSAGSGILAIDVDPAVD